MTRSPLSSLVSVNLILGRVDGACWAISPSANASMASSFMKAPDGNTYSTRWRRLSRKANYSRTVTGPSLRWREASASAARGRGELVPGGGLGAQQIAHEIIPAAAHHVGLIAETVIAVGQQQEIEILIRLD